MLEAHDLTCLRGDRKLFANISFQLNEGGLLYLKGQNGSGKTSLLRILLGLLPSAAGNVSWCGRPIGDQSEAYRAQLCYLGHLNAIKEEMTPLENLLITTRLASAPLGDEDAFESLAQFGLAGREDVPCKYLSQGQKRRVALARLVKNRGALWILDEPFVALDLAAVEGVSRLISAHLLRGGLVVMTTHQAVTIDAKSTQELRLS